MTSPPPLLRALGSGRNLLLAASLLLSIAASSNAGPLGSSWSHGGALEQEGGLSIAAEGTLRLLSYNIAGLPEGISQSRPKTNIPRISPLLNDYDLVLIQEDFSFPHELRSHVEHPHRSSVHQSRSLLGFGDGLSRFARFPYEAFSRVRWRQCHGTLGHGNDCLAYKGFTVATHLLAEGVPLDVYNLHMDAGGSSGDRKARRAQLKQLARSIAVRSRDRAVIVAGDTNMGRHDEDLVAQLMDDIGLQDACRALQCPDPQRIDRVLYRGSDALSLAPLRWSLEEQFVDDRGRPLSDHLAVGVDLAWSSHTEGVAKLD